MKVYIRVAETYIGLPLPLTNVLLMNKPVCILIAAFPGILKIEVISEDLERIRKTEQKNFRFFYSTF